MKEAAREELGHSMVVRSPCTTQMALSPQLRPLLSDGEAAYAAQQQVVGGPVGHIGSIGAREDIHGVAVLHLAGHLAGGGEGLSGTYSPDRGVGGHGKQEERG
ncbi:MAG: hypothetical protein R2810_04970 [Flavobacteriales bacterium]